MPDQNEDFTTCLTRILNHFQSVTPGVLGCAVISAEGFTIASELPMGIEEQRVAGMAAAMLALGEQTTKEFAQGSLRRVFVEGERGHLVVMSAGPDALLSTLTQKDAKLGLVFLQMQRAAEDIRREMAQIMRPMQLA